LIQISKWWLKCEVDDSNHNKTKQNKWNDDNDRMVIMSGKKKIISNTHSKIGEMKWKRTISIYIY